MKPRDQLDLLNEVFADETLDALREDTLASGLSALRSRRRTRAVRTAALTGIPLLILAATILWHRPHNPVVAEPARVIASVPPSSVKFYPATVASDAPPITTISDEDLLAMFKGHSVALLGSEGREKLVFFDKPQTR